MCLFLAVENLITVCPCSQENLDKSYILAIFVHILYAHSSVLVVKVENHCHFCFLNQPMLVGSGTPSVTPNNETVTSGEDHM